MYEILKRDKNVSEVLITEEQLKQRISELGKQISFDYYDKKPLIIGVLKGCFIFMSDIIREITVPCMIDFMIVSSYNKSMVSSRVVNVIKDLNVDVNGLDILIIEDILDTGLTLDTLCNLLISRNPKSLRICTLLDKPERRIADIQPHYTGFQIEDKFVIGYGLDYAEEYRNLPYIGVLNPNT